MVQHLSFRGPCYLSWNFHFNSFQRSALRGSKSRETAELIIFLLFMTVIQKGFKPDNSILVSPSPNLLPIRPPEQEGGSNRHQSPRMRLPKIQLIFPILRGLHPIWFIYDWYHPFFTGRPCHYRPIIGLPDEEAMARSGVQIWPHNGSEKTLVSGRSGWAKLSRLWILCKVQNGQNICRFLQCLIPQGGFFSRPMSSWLSSPRLQHLKGCQPWSHGNFPSLRPFRGQGLI